MRPLWYIRLVRFLSAAIVLGFLLWDFLAHFNNLANVGIPVGLTLGYGTTEYELLASLVLAFVFLNGLLFLLASALESVLEDVDDGS